MSIEIVRPIDKSITADALKTLEKTIYIICMNEMIVEKMKIFQFFDEPFLPRDLLLVHQNLVKGSFFAQFPRQQASQSSTETPRKILVS